MPSSRPPSSTGSRAKGCSSIFIAERNSAISSPISTRPTHSSRANSISNRSGWPRAFAPKYFAYLDARFGQWIRSRRLPVSDLLENGQCSFKFTVEEPHRVENFAEARGCFCPVSVSEGEDTVVTQVSHDG